MHIRRKPEKALSGCPLAVRNCDFDFFKDEIFKIHAINSVKHALSIYPKRCMH